MFWPHITKLSSFYSSSLGKVACRRIRLAIRACWPSVEHTHLVGIGYTPPYLEPLLDKTNHITSLMPAAQGVMHWPDNKPNLAFISEEGELPLADSSADKILVAHALEHSHEAHHMLREIWRALAPGGRLLVVVPNRTGIWARVDYTPFGHGQPFTLRQIRKLLHDCMFVPTQAQPALFLPPTQSRLLMKTARIWENIGSTFLQPFAGVWVIEAEKQIYAVRPEWKKARHMQKLRIPTAEPVSPCEGRFG